MPLRLLLLMALPVLACSDDPVEPESPAEPEPIVENRGELLTTGVGTSGLDGSTPWLWLNAREVAYLVPQDTAAGPGSGVWVMDALSYQRRHLLELDAARSLAFASVEGRLYVTDSNGLHALDPREAEPDAVKLAGTARTLVGVSPNGRYRVEALPGGEGLLVDAVVGDSLALESVGPHDRPNDDGTFLFARPTGLGALDVASRTIRTWEYPAAVGELREIRGPTAYPEVTFVEPSGGARTLQAREPSQGFLERYRAVLSGPVQSSTLDVLELARSPEGWRFVFAVVRGTRSVEAGVEWAWEIVVYDASNGRSKSVATGFSDGVLPRGLAITPDGTRMLYGVEGGLYLVSLN